MASLNVDGLGEYEQASRLRMEIMLRSICAESPDATCVN